MDHRVIGYIFVAVIVLCWLGAVVSWGHAAYYMYKTMARFHPDRQWGKFIPISIFLPWFFTEEGNLYRAKLVRYGGLFIVLVALCALIGIEFDALIPR